MEQIVGSGSLEAKKRGKCLEINAIVPRGIHEVEIRLFSTRNRAISRMSDVSPADPNPHAGGDREYDRDLWYPVVDMELEPGMGGIALFAVSGKSEIIINGPYFKSKKPITPQMVIPANRLEYWENSIFVEPLSAELRGFYLRQRFPLVTQRLHHCFALLSEQWSGEVVLCAVTPEGTHELATARVVEGELPVRKANQGEGLARERLLSALESALDFTIRCQVTNPQSPAYGSLHLLYDLDASMHRTSYWIWGCSPSVTMLLKAADLPELSQDSMV